MLCAERGRLILSEEAEYADWATSSDELLGQYMLFSGHNGALGGLFFCSMPVLQRWDPATETYSNVRAVACPHCASSVPVARPHSRPRAPPLLSRGATHGVASCCVHLA